MPSPRLQGCAAFERAESSAVFRRPRSAKQCRRLEARLGVRLLNDDAQRDTDRCGQRLLDRLAPTLGEIEAALDGLNSVRDRPAGRLRLNVPGIVARCVLPDIACRFLKLRSPEIVLEVTSNDALVDVLAQGFDAGIRYEESLQQDMIALPIGPRRQRYVGAASPDYIALHGAPQHPRELVDHPAILHRFSSGRMQAWAFERGEEAVSVAPVARMIADSIDMEIAAAKAGLGMIFTFEDFLRDALASGELVQVLPEWEEAFSGPFLYYHSRKYMPAPLRAFVDFVRAEGR